MITVYDVKTGEQVELDSVDARERVNAGLAVRNAEDLKQKDDPEATEVKVGSKAWIVAQLEGAGVEFDKGASKAELQDLLDALGGAE